MDEQTRITAKSRIAKPEALCEVVLKNIVFLKMDIGLCDSQPFVEQRKSGSNILIMSPCGGGTAS